VVLGQFGDDEIRPLESEQENGVSLFLLKEHENKQRKSRKNRGLGI